MSSLQTALEKLDPASPAARQVEEQLAPRELKVRFGQKKPRNQARWREFVLLQHKVSRADPRSAARVAAALGEVERRGVGACLGAGGVRLRDRLL